MTDRPAPSPLREIDDDAIGLAARLMRGAVHGALAVLEPGSGHPLASRTAVAVDETGAAIILISTLAAHAGALQADARCSLLLGEPGKGDPLAHPRVTLIGSARRLGRDGDESARARERFLASHPKSALYADFADFAFWKIEPERASLNGGFGRAWQLDRAAIARAAAG